MLASKCSCCRQENIESIDHLFVGSDVAQLVWCNFAKLLYKLVIARNIQQLFKSWLQGHRQKSHMAYVVQSSYSLDAGSYGRADVERNLKK